MKLFNVLQEMENPVLETWEVEALITQAVILEDYNVERLSKLQVPNVCVRAVRISTLFMRGATTMHVLLATCGYPVSIAEVSIRLCCHSQSTGSSIFKVCPGDNRFGN
jgi:hypothetical protein